MSAVTVAVPAQAGPPDGPAAHRGGVPGLDQAALLRLRRVRLVRRARRAHLAHRRAVLLRTVVSR